MGVVGATRTLLTTRPAHRLAWLVRVATSPLHRRLMQATSNTAHAQAKVLHHILQTNAATQWGKRHEFSSLRDATAYRQAVPIVRYDDIAPLIQRMLQGEAAVLTHEDPLFYATSSGTTGAQKMVPVTSDFVRECQVANRVLYRTLALSFPHLLGGQRLAMRSPTTTAVAGNPHGAHAGSITAALGGGVDADSDGSARHLDAVPTAVFRVADFHARYALALRFALQGHITLLSAINPSTLVLFAKVLQQEGDRLLRGLHDGTFGVQVDDDTAKILQPLLRAMPERALQLRARAEPHGWRFVDVFPDLRGAATWLGGHGPVFVQQLRQSIGDLPIVDYGYGASEGCFGAPIEANTASSLLMPHGHFIELVREDDRDRVQSGASSSLLLHEAEVGERYQVVVTTSGGLYRYDMADIVEVTGKVGDAPLVRFLHKTGTMSSMVGEKLSESQVMTAVSKTTSQRPLHSDAGFLLQAVLGDACHYRLWLEQSTHALDDDSLAQTVDDALCAANDEYRTKRQSLRLSSVRIVRVPAGSFARVRAQRVANGAPDAHVKQPILDRDGRYAQLLEQASQR
jgi:hypothetical protein